MPAVIALTSLLVFSGRYAAADQAVQVAAAEAARAVSMARTPGVARADAVHTARQVLASRGLACDRLSVGLDATGLAAPPGRPATATATVSCTVRVDDLLPLAPGDRTLTASALSPIDTYRE